MYICTHSDIELQYAECMTMKLKNFTLISTTSAKWKCFQNNLS